MALDALAVEWATAGRLGHDGAETQRQIDAALAAARNYCGWHVTPEMTDVEVTIDGPGGPLLILPTLKLTALTAVTEKTFYGDNIIVDVQDLDWSTRGLVAKRSRMLWTDRFQGVTVTMSHGFDDAPDFDAALLAAIDRGAFSTVADTVKVIGPFQYDTTTVTSGIFTATERAILDRYMLERLP
jgi:hypothetical protein